MYKRQYVDTEVVPEDLQIPVQNGTCKSVTVKPVEQHTIDVYKRQVVYIVFQTLLMKQEYFRIQSTMQL